MCSVDLTEPSNFSCADCISRPCLISENEAEVSLKHIVHLMKEFGDSFDQTHLLWKRMEQELRCIREAGVSLSESGIDNDSFLALTPSQQKAWEDVSIPSSIPCEGFYCTFNPSYFRSSLDDAPGSVDELSEALRGLDKELGVVNVDFLHKFVRWRNEKQ